MRIDLTFLKSNVSEARNSSASVLLFALLSGLLSVIVITYLLWFLGYGIGRFHWLAFPFGWFIASFLAGGLKKWWVMFSGIGLIVIVWAWSLCCSYLYGLNWDGMLIHKEFVMALEDGWNPTQDPFYQDPVGECDWEKELSRRKIQWAGCNVRFGYVFQAVLGSAMGSTEAGKATNLVFLLLIFSAAWHFLSRWGLRGKKLWFLSMLVALNPVWILQSISFWEDAQFAALSSAIVLLGIQLVRGGTKLDYVAWVMCLFLTMGAKRSGLAFAGLSICMLFLIHLVRKPDLRRVFKYGGLALFLIGLVFISGSFLGVWKTSGLLPYKFEQLLSANKMEHLFSETTIARVPKLSELSGPSQFLAATLSEGTMVVEDIDIKFPFSITKREFSVYTHIFAAPWFGGFGPWYGACLVLSLVSFVFSFFSFQKESRTGFFAVGYWLIFMVAILFFMPAYFPRWVPFMWLFPVLLHLSFISGRTTCDGLASFLKSTSPLLTCVDLRPGSSFWEKLSFLSVSMLFIGSLCLFTLNILGHLRASSVVHEQLEFLGLVKNEPVEVVFADFPSNRDWFRYYGIKINPVTKLSRPNAIITLGRTNTQIAVPLCSIDFPFELGGKKWPDVESWSRSVDDRLGVRDRWHAWIKPNLIEGTGLDSADRE